MTGVDLQAILTRVIDPGLALLPAPLTSDPARIYLLAIGLQESGFIHRRQYPSGPARGFWQFEPTGVTGVRTHPTSRFWLSHLCKLHGIPFETRAIHSLLWHNDPFAAAVARLLLFTDPRPFPLDAQLAYLYYRRLWRPGKPRPKAWPANWAQAYLTVRT